MKISMLKSGDIICTKDSQIGVVTGISPRKIFLATIDKDIFIHLKDIKKVKFNPPRCISHFNRNCVLCGQDDEIKHMIDTLSSDVSNVTKELYKKKLINCFEQLQQESEDLKEKHNKLLKENFKLKQHPILTEFEKWLEEQINNINKSLELHLEENSKISLLSTKSILEKALDKLQELKESKK